MASEAESVLAHRVQQWRLAHARASTEPGRSDILARLTEAEICLVLVQMSKGES